MKIHVKVNEGACSRAGGDVERQKVQPLFSTLAADGQSHPVALVSSHAGPTDGPEGAPKPASVAVEEKPAAQVAVGARPPDLSTEEPANALPLRGMVTGASNLSSLSSAAGVSPEAPAAISPAGPAAIMAAKFWDLKRRRITISPPWPSTRASGIGEECERRLFYDRTVLAEQRIPHEPGLQAIFDLGIAVQRFVLRELEDAGIEIVQTERDYHDLDLELSGHVDALLRLPPAPERYAGEIKGLNPYTSDSIETLDDIRNHKQAWVRKYFDQLQTYLYLSKRRMGVFVLLNKSTGAITFIECPIDEVYVAGLIAKAKRIRDARRAGVAPDRRPSPECERCPFVAVCGPDRSYGPGVQVVADEELEALLARRAEIEDVGREFTRLDKAVKAALPRAPETLIGDFVVRGQEVERDGYVVKPSKYWKFEIERLKGANP